MIFQHWYLSRYPAVFRSMTGLSVTDFATLFQDLQAAFAEAELTRHRRPTRQRAIGGGAQFQFCPRDQLLCTVVWLRQYPTNEALAYFFGVSDSTVSRAIHRWLPLLAAGVRQPEGRCRAGRPAGAADLGGQFRAAGPAA